MKTNEITTILEYKLSHDRECIGQRLRSERELAALFGSTASRVRTSLNRLERRGIITRHWGSGTYVRRHVHEVVKLPPELATQIPNVSIYAQSNGNKSVMPEQNRPVRYQVGLWGDLSHWSVTNQKVLASMATRAGELGQRLSMHSTVSQVEKSLSSQQIHKELQADPSDVYIVTLSNSEEFYQATGGSNDQVVYFYTGTPCFDDQLRFQPLLMFDTGNALRMGLDLLKRQGYRRIAYLACEPHNDITMDTIYRSAVQGLELEYCRALACNLDMSKGLPAIKQLLELDDAPDAFYMGDDHLMPIVDEALRQKGVTPGGEFGVITVSNRGIALPGSVAWSRMEFDPEQLGRRVIDLAIQKLRHPERVPTNESIQPRWVSGISHWRGGSASL